MPPTLPRILVVDDEPENLRALERTLRKDFDIETYDSAREALHALAEKTNHFSVVISDQRMPEMSGTEFLSKVAEKTPLVTRVILTAYTETKEMLEAINRAEIFRYITKPWDNADLVSAIYQAVEHHRLKFENESLIRDLAEKNARLEDKEKELRELNQNLETQVVQRTQELERANKRLSELAMTDPLTKVLNRRAFFLKFDEEIQRATRYQRSIAIAMIDVDHFKSFNDMEGHLLGDEALKKVAQTIISKIRKTDVLCRYGGEEFCLMMPETDKATGANICERLRASIETTTFRGQEATAYLTISIGLAGFPNDGRSRTELVQASDEALYEAKRSGRNRVIEKN